MTKPSSFRIECGDSEISADDLRGKGLIGQVMWDILFYSQVGCKDRQARLELLEATAKEIIERVLNDKTKAG